MISHKHKCIFIHCQKCGGETVEELLGAYDNMARKLDWLTPEEKHWTYKECIDNYGEETWNSYFTFSFVRNPWDRIISWIFYSNRMESDPTGKVLQPHQQHLPDEYVRIKLKNPKPYWVKNTYTSLLGIKPNKKHKLDFIGKTENMKNDLNFIRDKLKIQKDIKILNKTKHRKHYTEYYDDNTMRLIGELFKDDIEYFGYKFGE